MFTKLVGILLIFDLLREVNHLSFLQIFLLNAIQKIRITDCI